MKKAVIIADYGVNTGMGHIKRCASLAAGLSDDFEVTFLCNDDDYFQDACLIAQSAHAKAKTAANVFDASNIDADVLILDSYKNHGKFLTNLRNAVDVCVVIDDNNILPFYDADIVLNQNIGAEQRVYRARKDTTFLLGAKYAMVSGRFIDTAPINITLEVKNIAVTMGGADLKNTTLKVLEFVREYNRYTYEVIIGGGFNNIEEIKEAAGKSDNINLVFNADMAEILSRCQGAVSACGSTIYELSLLGIPTVGIVTADNQKDLSLMMEKTGLILNAGLESAMERSSFRKLFEDMTGNTALRKKMHNSQLKEVSREGVKNIKDAIVSKLAKKQ
jgi:UDP-2,4-diacetamido-2,4,6-trideoxy-beta-L-altropyranose hydrolase